MKQCHLFPPNDKNYHMKTRDPENFKVYSAHTERFKKSPIIYMQNQLNKEAKRKIIERKLWNH